jgi:hypothetical protein
MGGILGGKKSNVAKMQNVGDILGMAAAMKFDTIGPVKQQQGTLEAIELARENLGNYQPELDESRRLTDAGISAITKDDTDRYMNPYLQDVLDFSIRDMEDAAAQRRQQRKAITSKSGNDFASAGAIPNRYQIEDDLADRSMYREIGGLSAKQRAAAYQQALAVATDEKQRQVQGGTTYGNYATQTQQLGNADVGMLTNVGQLEAIPEINERNHLMQTINAYNASTTGANESVANSEKKSVLSQIGGLVGGVTEILNPGVSSLMGSFGGGGGSSSGISASGGASAGSLMDMGFGTQMASGMGGSDRRLKKDIKRIGTHKLGIGLYEWTYLWGKKAIGVMADELRKVMPEAVTNFFGYDMVDYLMINGENNG